MLLASRLLPRGALALLFVSAPLLELHAQPARESSPLPLMAMKAEDRAELALSWAPIHYQDVDTTGSDSLGGAADYVTNYDFDGDLDGRNNWDHAADGQFSLRAHVYYSVVETTTHWFIQYMFFHPRDWDDQFFETEHENDAEGVLLAVARDGSRHGSLKAAITVAHRDFYSFLPPGSDWRGGVESVDGRLGFEEYEGRLHPVTAQQAKGHGLKARPYYDIQGGDGVVYYPSLTTAEAPEHPNDRHVRYRLVDVFEPGGLWDNRDNPLLFARLGSFAGDGGSGCGDGTFACTSDAANAPWGWDDHDDALPRGALAFEPARVCATYFVSVESSSPEYSYQPYGVDAAAPVRQRAVASLLSRRRSR